MGANQKDYVDVVYNEVDRPFTAYPDLLAKYLYQRFGMKKGDALLDLGCGRGEFLRGFMSCGVKGYGADQSRSAEKLCPGATLKVVNLETEKLPFEDATFDFVYSKSVIEHFYYPEKIFNEIYRVLKPGGMILSLCPAWEYNYKIYFEDYTHRTPFMKCSLRDIHRMTGYENIEVEYFKQLPILWNRSTPFFKFFSELTRIACPEIFRRKTKWIRFSKEIMLLSSATKPNAHHP